MQERHEGKDLDEVFYGKCDRNVSWKDVARYYYKRLNSDQKQAFRSISNAIDGTSSDRLFFIEGEGGTGIIYYR